MTTTLHHMYMVLGSSHDNPCQVWLAPTHVDSHQWMGGWVTGV